MPASLNRDDASYLNFDAGMASQINPLSDKDRDLIRFSARRFKSVTDRDSAITNKFGICLLYTSPSPRD